MVCSKDLPPGPSRQRRRDPWSNYFCHAHGKTIQTRIVAMVRDDPLLSLYVHLVPRLVTYMDPARVGVTTTPPVSYPTPVTVPPLYPQGTAKKSTLTCTRCDEPLQGQHVRRGPRISDRFCNKCGLQVRRARIRQHRSDELLKEVARGNPGILAYVRPEVRAWASTDIPCITQ